MSGDELPATPGTQLSLRRPTSPLNLTDDASNTSMGKESLDEEDGIFPRGLIKLCAERVKLLFVWLPGNVAMEKRPAGERDMAKKKGEGSPCRVEFSEKRVKLVNDGSEPQRHTYQLQNGGPASVRVRAAIGPDSDPVSQTFPSSILHR